MFVLRKSRKVETADALIYMRISVNGERVETSVNRRIDPSKWDGNIQRARGCAEAARTLNEYLDDIENSLRKTFNLLLENDTRITASLMRDMFTGKLEKHHTLK